MDSAAPTPTDVQDWADVRECGVCHALVLNDSRVAHLDVHEKTLRTLDNLLETTTALVRARKAKKKESK